MSVYLCLLSLHFLRLNYPALDPEPLPVVSDKEIAYETSGNEGPIPAPEDDDEDLSEGGLYPYDPTQSDIDIREETPSVYELVVRRYDFGDLIIDPEFQRNFVWDKVRMSRFIESIILNFPIPSFYLNETREGKQIVVDGLQRITTLQRFMRDEFRLQGLHAMSYLNGKTFSDLKTMPGGFRAKVENKKLNVFLIKPSVPVEVVYDIFNRINTGGLNLNRQEIRNCLFIGKGTHLLAELAKNPFFLAATAGKISPKRKKDQETVLRCLAFLVLDYEQYYKGNMSLFLDEALRRLNLMREEELASLIKRFEIGMAWSDDLFGPDPFKLESGGQKANSINLALMDALFNFCSAHTNEFFKNHRPRMRENYFILQQDEEFLDAVRASTGDRSRVLFRIQRANEILGKID